VRYEMKTTTAMYYFRVCAKVGGGYKLKVAVIMKCVAGEEAVFVCVCVCRLKVKDAITLGGAAGCGVEVDG